TPTQKQAHPPEKDFNFREITWLVSCLKTPLTTKDELQDRTIYHFIVDIGQYSEIAHGSVLPRFAFDHLEELSHPGFPLEGYDALIHDKPVLVDHFNGKVAHLQCYVAFREQAGQLVIAISGTSSLTQGYYDMCCRKTPYLGERKGIKVHSGFWKMYQGLQESAKEDLKKGIENYGERVLEIVVTGHS
ncbi:hypothetical protein BU17DRAFT_14605, partial [Hysterangium stoloniferum]